LGRRATASQRAETIGSLYDPGQREALAADPDRITRLPTPLLADEKQLEPTFRDRVRTAVDHDPTGGWFRLTGSAGVTAGVRTHSGAGRIGSLLLRPLGLSERAIVEPTVSLGSGLRGESGGFTGESPLGVPAYADEILGSGFPGIRTLPDPARTFQLDSYIERIINAELPENRVHIGRPGALRAWLAAYGAATATDASYSAILDAATAGQPDKPARGTVDGYREQLTRLFILDPLPPWIPMFNPLKRLTRTPKHRLVDPALAARSCE